MTMTDFVVMPAIDLKGGRCVRLRQGRAEEETVYSDSPADMARRWLDAGARYLHIVDLDGAFEGRPVHIDAIRAIAGVLTIPFEVGGGLRSAESVRRVIECGADRAIVGTRALQNPAAMGGWVAEFGARLAVGIDARNGMVQIKGWVETTGTRAVDLAAAADRAGVKTLIYTDTATDGMLRGVNAVAVDEICAAVGCDVIASGGVSSVDDIRALGRLGRRNLRGAIVGKALYEGTVQLPDLQAALA
jgi:phosphoribosylformimino-5-aminoimidazole carboxamide ribotide isomerase